MQENILVIRILYDVKLLFGLLSLKSYITAAGLLSQSVVSWTVAELVDNPASMHDMHVK